MSLIRLFIDEDSMDRRFVRALRTRRMDITTAGEIGTTSFSDEDQLMLATEQQRVFYTCNVGDFCQLHSTYMYEHSPRAAKLETIGSFTAPEDLE